MTPRGLALSGSFTNPVDSGDAAILFSHSFLANRRSGKHFDRLGRAYRSAGYATLAFDFSGHGTSPDGIIIRESLIEDLRAASGWLADQGFTRQIVHGHSFGALVALAAHPTHVKTMVLSSPVLGPRTYDWEAIFSQSQLDELEVHGVTTIPDDLPGPRQNFMISKQTLVDLSMVNTKEVLSAQVSPLLIIHDRDDVEAGLVDVTQNAFAHLPDGSRVEIVHDARFGRGERPEALADPAVEWARQWVPVAG